MITVVNSALESLLPSSATLTVSKRVTDIKKEASETTHLSCSSFLNIWITAGTCSPPRDWGGQVWAQPPVQPAASGKIYHAASQQGKLGTKFLPAYKNPSPFQDQAWVNFLTLCVFCTPELLSSKINHSLVSRDNVDSCISLILICNSYILSIHSPSIKK